MRSEVVKVKRDADGIFMGEEEERSVYDMLSDLLPEIKDNETKSVRISVEIVGEKGEEKVERLREDLIAVIGAGKWDLIVQGSEFGYPASHKARCKRIVQALSNPSEIPNSSEFLVTEADQREADKAIADGSAKLQMPETGHGITEVSDAAEGG